MPKLANTLLVSDCLALAPDVRPGTSTAALLPGSCLMQSETDEPVFVLCARDPHALVAIDIWLHERRAAVAEMRECWSRDPENATLAAAVAKASKKVHDAAQVAQAFEAWATRPLPIGRR